MQNCDSPILRSFKRLHTPSLQILGVDFVPGPTVARDLIRCKLSEMKVYEPDSLKEFLASANALQYLFIQIWGKSLYVAYDLPSLRSLVVDFIPHPSFARHLTRFTFRWIDGLSMAELLDFLSSTEVLQALSIYGYLGLVDRGPFEASSMNSMRVVTLPHLVSCDIQQGDLRVKDPLLAPVLITKLRMPVLRRLEIQVTSGDVGLDEGLEVFDDHPPDILDVPYGRLIRLEGCPELTLDFVHAVA